jgi:hypothetical protein
MASSVVGPKTKALIASKLAAEQREAEQDDLTIRGSEAASGTCHRCGGGLARGNRDNACACKACGTRFHAMDCGDRLLAVGFEELSDACPKVRVRTHFCVCDEGSTTGVLKRGRRQRVLSPPLHPAPPHPPTSAHLKECCFTHVYIFHCEPRLHPHRSPVLSIFLFFWLFFTLSLRNVSLFSVLRTVRVRGRAVRVPRHHGAQVAAAQGWHGSREQEGADAEGAYYEPRRGGGRRRWG